MQKKYSAKHAGLKTISTEGVIWGAEARSNKLMMQHMVMGCNACATATSIGGEFTDPSEVHHRHDALNAAAPWRLFSVMYTSLKKRSNYRVSTQFVYIKTTAYWHTCLGKKEYICGQWTHFSRRSRRQPRPNTGSHHQDGQASAPACWVDVATGVRRASLHREIYLSLSGCGQVALMRVARDAPDVLQLESFNKVVQPSTFFH